MIAQMNPLQTLTSRAASVGKRLGALACSYAMLHPFPLQAQTICIGDHVVLAGASVAVPVVIGNAAGVASVSMTVNFDPQILALESVTNAGLGQNFSLKYTVLDGRVRVGVAGRGGLPGGNGSLVVLRFRANAGVLLGMASAVTLADRRVGGEYGRDLAWPGTLTRCDGTVRVVAPTTDSNANGLPDWWEETFFGGPDHANPTADSDGDGMTNLQEFRAGTNPIDSADYLHLEIEPESNMRIKLSVPTVTGKNYQFESSNDMRSWHPMGPVLVGNGRKAELVETAGGQRQPSFYRVLILP